MIIISTVRGRCVRIKRVTTKFATRFVCSRCGGTMKEMVYSIEKLCDEVERVKGFCFLGEKLNTSGGC